MDNNSPSGHHHTTLSGYIFTTKACIDNWKNFALAHILDFVCFCHFVSLLFVFIVLSLLYSVPCQEIGWEERLWNDLCGVEDIKP